MAPTSFHMVMTVESIDSKSLWWDILEIAKLLLPAFKVGGFTELVAVFESHCSLCACRKLSEKWPVTFVEAMQFMVPTFLFLKPQLDGTNEFYMVITVESFELKLLWLDILEILKQRLFSIRLVFLLLGG